MGKLIAWVLVLGVLSAATWFGAKACAPAQKQAAEVAKGPAAVLHRAESVSGDAAATQLRIAIGSYQAANGRFPETLETLVGAGQIQNVPAGNWQYNAATGELTGP